MGDPPGRRQLKWSARAVDADRREAALDAREHAADERERDLNAAEDAGLGRQGQASQRRDADAGQRDTLADGRDVAAGARDEVAVSREADATGVIAQPTLGPPALMQAFAVLRTGSEADRKKAGADRELSAWDRAASLADRVASGHDRNVASAQRESAIHDGLTGALRREQGLFALEQEVGRAGRAAGLLCFAFVDVDGLKVVNDSVSHAAGDQVLRTVSHALRAHLRPHDSIVRYGGDEFVCALPGLTLNEVQERFDAINVTLADGAVPASVTTGLAMGAQGETVQDLIGRADAELHRQRKRRDAPGWRL